MKYEIYNLVAEITPDEVARELLSNGVLDLTGSERITCVSVSCGSDLEVEIHDDDTGADRTETFDMFNVHSVYPNAGYTVWAKNENGDDCLLTLF